MRVNLSDIRKEGLDLDFNETAKDLDLEYPDTGFEGEIHTSVHLARLGDNVMVTGETAAGLVLECARCLKPFRVPLRLDLKSLFSPSSGTGTAGGKEAEVSEDEMEYHFSGKTLDLGDLIREQILLAMPMVPVCRPDCKGLCGVCRKDLNLEECVCHTEEKDGPSQT